MNPGLIINRAVLRVKYNIGRLLKEAGLQIDRFGSRMSDDVGYTLDFSRHRKLLPLYD
jgi:hypothetical protein